MSLEDPRATLALRVVGAGVAMVTITLLLMQIAHRIVDAPTEPDQTPAVVDAPGSPEDPQGLKVLANEPVRAHIELDGKVAFDGILCAGSSGECEPASVEFPAAEVTLVELADLTRARVIYNGTRVEPLGNLTSARRLVFIDDLP